MTARLEAADVAFSWGSRRVLDGVSLSVDPGECLAVIGPNGAGKTTLLRLLAGVSRAERGAVRLDGRDLGGLTARERARRVAYVPQSRPGSIALSVGEFVLLGRYPHRTGLGWAPGSADYAAAERAMRQMGVQALSTRGLDELSGGERQAVFLAAALAQGGEALVLDEPTAHLDPRHLRETARRIERLRRAGGRALVVATHDLGLAAWVADRALALAGGRVAAEGAAAEVLAPESLAAIFGAPFGSVMQGGRTVPVLELGG